MSRPMGRLWGSELQVQRLEPAVQAAAQKHREGIREPFPACGKAGGQHFLNPCSK